MSKMTDMRKALKLAGQQLVGLSLAVHHNFRFNMAVLTVAECDMFHESDADGPRTRGGGGS